jgi:phosphoglycerate dehydrogenase-like enzyme
MAQYALGMILMFSQRIPIYMRQQRQREWKLVKIAPVQGKVLCVLGTGSVGGQAAARCKALGMHVVGVRATPRPTPNIDEVFGIDRMRDVLARADFVLNCLPLTDATRGLMDAAAFAAMKTGAYYINIGRGAVDDEPALVAALKSGALAGAAIDVFRHEPLPGDSELWELENLVITPHSSGEFPTWEMDTVARFMDQLDLWIAGKKLRFVADPNKGY